MCLTKSVYICVYSMCIYIYIFLSEGKTAIICPMFIRARDI
jgi:hypothetical protein